MTTDTTSTETATPATPARSLDELRDQLVHEGYAPRVVDAAIREWMRDFAGDVRAALHNECGRPEPTICPAWCVEQDAHPWDGVNPLSPDVPDDAAFSRVHHSDTWEDNSGALRVRLHAVTYEYARLDGTAWTEGPKVSVTLGRERLGRYDAADLAGLSTTFDALAAHAVEVITQTEARTARAHA